MLRTFNGECQCLTLSLFHLFFSLPALSFFISLNSIMYRRWDKARERESTMIACTLFISSRYFKQTHLHMSAMRERLHHQSFEWEEKSCESHCYLGDAEIGEVWERGEKFSSSPCFFNFVSRETKQWKSNKRRAQRKKEGRKKSEVNNGSSVHSGLPVLTV